MTPVPRLPRWAAAAGIHEPEPGEDFRVYWARVAVPEWVVERSLCVDHVGAEDVANERIATWLMRQIPQAFDAYVESSLGHYRRTNGDVTLDHVLRFHPHASPMELATA